MSTPRGALIGILAGLVTGVLVDFGWAGGFTLGFFQTLIAPLISSAAALGTAYLGFRLTRQMQLDLARKNREAEWEKSSKDRRLGELADAVSLLDRAIDDNVSRSHENAALSLRQSTLFKHQTRLGVHAVRLGVGSEQAEWLRLVVVAMASAGHQLNQRLNGREVEAVIGQVNADMLSAQIKFADEIGRQGKVVSTENPA